MTISTLTKLKQRAETVRTKLEEPPPGPFRPGFWRSPLRGPWLTSFLGTLLVPAMTIIFITGLISEWQYYPALGRNATTPVGDTIPVLFHLPLGLPWGYAFTQGLHTTLGIITIPLVLAKLWSVIPKLFQWPGVRSVANALERLLLLLLVASILVELVTGTLDIEYWYPWGFDFYTVHYYGALIFSAAFTLHALVKLPTIRKAYRERGFLTPLREDLAHTIAEPPEDTGLAPTNPAQPTLSRRGLLGMVGGAAATLFAVQVGQSIGGPFRRLAVLAARGRVFGTGPNDFQITTTFASAFLTRADVGPNWRLHVSGGSRELTFTREELLALPQHDATLPIACVEGWSTTQHWSGVRLADLRDMAGASPDAILHVDSVQPRGSFRHIALAADQVATTDAMLALRVNGVDLSPDHGYPARVIVPDAPGVHNTKWVGTMTFAAR